MEFSSHSQVVSGVVPFMLGGNSEFTIFQEPNIQYKYNLKMNSERTLAFVYIKGVYQGYIRKESNDKYEFHLGNKGNENYDKRAIQGLLWVLNRGDNLPDKVKVYHHGKCSVCGRKLTDAESLMYGIGPTCREKVRNIWGI